MKTKNMDYAVATLGMIAIIAGLVLLKAVAEPQGILLPLPYICIGIGCGMFGGGISSIINRKIMKKHPDAAKQKRIVEQDERNVLLATRAGAKAYKMAMYVFWLLLLIFTLMGMETVYILLLLGGYLFVAGYAVWYRIKLEKEL